MRNVKSAITNFRSGNGFFLAFAIFVVLWFAARAIWHFDPDFGLLNLLLSMEASLMVSVLLDMQLRADVQLREMISKLLTTSEEIEETVEEIEQALEA